MQGAKVHSANIVTNRQKRFHPSAKQGQETDRHFFDGRGVLPKMNLQVPPGASARIAFLIPAGPTLCISCQSRMGRVTACTRTLHELSGKAFQMRRKARDRTKVSVLCVWNPYV